MEFKLRLEKHNMETYFDNVEVGGIYPYNPKIQYGQVFMLAKKKGYLIHYCPIDDDDDSPRFIIKRKIGPHENFIEALEKVCREHMMTIRIKMNGGQFNLTSVPVNDDNYENIKAILPG